MKPSLKILLVLSGYAAAWYVADVAQSVFDARLTAADPQGASGGMAAFGVTLYFLQVFGGLSLLPTALAVFFLRSYPRIWDQWVRAAGYAAITGVVAALLLVPLILTSRTSGQIGNWWLSVVVLLIGLRIVGSVAFGMLNLLGLVFAPAPDYRSRFFRAGLLEGAVVLSGLLQFILLQRF